MGDAEAPLSRREFIQDAGIAMSAAVLPSAETGKRPLRPNVVLILSDQWRAQATGYAGDSNARTPALDRLARHSVNLTHASSGCSVCCPYRGSLLTGQYPLSHGVVVNDVPLKDNGNSLAQAFGRGGYDTAYIGKWHLYGSPDGRYGRRSAYVPRADRLGFDYWKAFECSHDYNHSPFFDGDDRTTRYWEGYDALAQSRDACRYIDSRRGSERPFLLVLAWGPPHDPYHTAPEQYRVRYEPRAISLRSNVPDDHRGAARTSLAGYYAHIAALDDCLKLVLEAIDKSGAADRTLVLFTSDHGDMHGSQGLAAKGAPWDESIRVPFLIRLPAQMGGRTLRLPAPIDAPDIMPTLLGLCGLPVPSSVQGMDLSDMVRGRRRPDPDAAALINVPIAFGMMRQQGLPEHRGLRTARFTYVRKLDGPWLLYDNAEDPYQMRNLCGEPAHRSVQADLDERLRARLKALGDDFLPGPEYAKRFGVEHYAEVRATPAQYRNPWSAAGEHP